MPRPQRHDTFRSRGCCLQCVDQGLCGCVAHGGSYRFYSYSDEGNACEPPHIHVVSGDKTAKFWLDPVELVHSKRLSASEIATVQRLVTRHRDAFQEAWHAHFDA